VDDTGVASRGMSLHDVRALVVEDDPDSADVICTVLERAGARVTAARSAREALDALDASGPFDIVISDIGMPEMDGYALVRRMRARDETAGVPAIALTAYARSEDAAHAMRAGFQEHLTKPVEEGQLLRAVWTWSHGRSPQKQGSAERR
jgi:CheY-like chemotaxis protein